jgi:hypothetical protein
MLRRRHRKREEVPCLEDKRFRRPSPMVPTKDRPENGEQKKTCAEISLFLSGHQIW